MFPESTLFPALEADDTLSSTFGTHAHEVACWAAWKAKRLRQMLQHPSFMRGAFETDSFTSIHTVHHLGNLLEAHVIEFEQFSVLQPNTIVIREPCPCRFAIEYEFRCLIPAPTRPDLAFQRSLMQFIRQII